MPHLASPLPSDLPLADACRRLLAWFAQAQRPLPWRKHYEPYSVWISEILLQQTQVETVLPYYRRWMRRFPTVQAVARAPLQKVLKAWEGLGYYSRARNVHQAARAIVRQHGGRVPEQWERLLRLPGVGPYTAGAIASIAFNQPVPAVDGNVARVLARLLALRRAPAEAVGRRILHGTAQALLLAAQAQGGTPRDLNQALMELGALVCRPKAPQCPRCPLSAACRARREGEPERYPLRPRRAPRPVRRGVMLLVRTAGGARLLLRRRPPRGLWGGLWEPPWQERLAGEAPRAALARLRKEVGLPPGTRVRPAGSLSHGLTHFQLELEVYRATVPSRATRDIPPLRWVSPARQAALPLSRLSHKALALPRAGQREPRKKR